MALNATSSLEVSVDTYATFSQVRALIPYTNFAATDYPTKAQAFSIIRDVYQEVNSLIGLLGYALPVASSNATAIRVLARFQALGAASSIELAATHRAGGSSEHAAELEKRYRLTWKAFEAGQIKLQGAALDDDHLLRRDERSITYQFHPVDGTESDPTFSRDMDF